MAIYMPCMAIYRPVSGLKGRIFKLWVLNWWVFNFWVRSTPPRGGNRRLYKEMNEKSITKLRCLRALVCLTTVSTKEGFPSPPPFPLPRLPSPWWRARNCGFVARAVTEITKRVYCSLWRESLLESVLERLVTPTLDIRRTTVGGGGVGVGEGGLHKSFERNIYSTSLCHLPRSFCETPFW